MAISNPQDRYDTPLDTRKTSTGKTVYRSVMPKTISEDSSMNVELQASTTTRMDRLANDLLDSPFNWWKIAAINKKVDGSLYFSPGTKIKLPSK
jgi:hypothetical protein